VITAELRGARVHATGREQDVSRALTWSAVPCLGEKLHSHLELCELTENALKVGRGRLVIVDCSDWGSLGRLVGRAIRWVGGRIDYSHSLS